MKRRRAFSSALRLKRLQKNALIGVQLAKGVPQGLKPSPI